MLKDLAHNNLESPVIVIVPPDPRRLLGLYTVAKTQHKFVLEFVARQRVDSHVSRCVEVGGAMFRQQHALDLRWVFVRRLVVKGPVKSVVKRGDTTYNKEIPRYKL